MYFVAELPDRLASHLDIGHSARDLVRASDLTLPGHTIASAYRLSDKHGRTMGHVFSAMHGTDEAATWFAADRNGRVTSMTFYSRAEAEAALRVLFAAHLLASGIPVLTGPEV